MSLVAYGASDDSEQSDIEEEIEKEQSPAEEKIIKAKDQISDDEEEYQQTVSSSSSSLFSNYSLETTPRYDKSTASNVSSSHQDLPPPQKREEINIEETELEEEVRQKPSELADAPKPPPKRTKQPVKITIPSLSEIPDEENDDNKQKPVVSSVRSGLFSLLPPPIHSAKKEINRPLIPHSLGKKMSASKPAAVQAKSVSSSSNNLPATNSKVATNSNAVDSHSGKKNLTAHKALIGYGSDDDDDDDDDAVPTMSQNFFSLGSKSTSKGIDSVSSTTTTDTHVGNKITDLSKQTKTVTAALQKETAEVGNSGLESKATSSSPIEKEEEEIVAVPEPGLTNDSPLDICNASKFSSWSSASSSYLGGLRPSSHSHASSSSSYTQSSSAHNPYNVQYNMVDAEDVYNHADHSNQASGTDVSSGDLQHMLDDKEFQKLHGKRKRGMEEAINFVDANVDDYVDPSELSKHITEESDYASIKNKNDMPTSQQKRKKQITYLAFQAKEKELELKNTWADNKLTRRQTQAKYGF